MCVPEMPPSFVIWENAMKHMDKNLSRVKRNIVDPGYQVPELALLVSSQSPKRCQLFLTNWLAIRLVWFSRLDHDPPTQFPTPQQWREILHCIPSKDALEATPESSMDKKTAKGRKLAALNIFSDTTVAMTLGLTLAPSETMAWHDRHISITSLTNPPPCLVRAILWEVYEVGWQYELYALNRALLPQLWAEHCMERLSFLHAIFLGSLGLMLWSEPLPTSIGSLGFTDSFPDNVRILCSFCLFLSTWPNAYPSFSETIPHKQCVQYEVLGRACHFYVQTFFDYFGHPPLLPHRFLLDYHK